MGSVAAIFRGIGVASPSRSRGREPKMIAKNEVFTEVTVYIDGASFYDCRFERCTIVFSGLLPAVLHNPMFVDCRFEAAGPADTTIKFLASMYQAGARELIEATFDNIRGRRPAEA
jgi:hypothetical protein